MRKLLTTALLLALAQNAAAISDAFTYQGSLDDNGAPANGQYDLQFTLTALGSPLGVVTLDDVDVVHGVFSVELDFDTAISTGDYVLKIGVRPGDSVDAYTVLTPDT